MPVYLLRLNLDNQKTIDPYDHQFFLQFIKFIHFNYISLKVLMPFDELNLLHKIFFCIFCG